MKVYNNVSELVGNTPLVKINKLNEGDANIYGKIEFFNPGGSIKDRISLNMIKQALDDKEINKDSTIVEGTSGNTGIGLSLISASLGLKTIIVMPDTMSQERRKLIASYGAKLVLTPGSEGMAGAVKKAQELVANNDNYFEAKQFDNPNNPSAHYLTTAPEIYEALNGKIDYIVAGVGTGGTISGISKYLKEKNPNVKAIAVEPKTSQVLKGGNAGPHKIQGIGANFIPNTYDASLIDEIIPVSDEDAIETSQKLASQEGIGVGISSGASMWAANVISKREGKDKNIVVIFPDTHERYLSTALFDFKD